VRRVVGAAWGMFLVAACGRDPRPVRLPPVVVTSPLRLPGAVVRGARLTWAVNRRTPVAFGDPMPVRVTEYCLQGTTRRGRYVRAGIVAADPRLFPLARYIELYIGREYAGRFLVDDTGLRIKGARIDVWTPNCREARRFGLQRGTAVLVARPQIEVRLAGSAGATIAPRTGKPNPR
jgi:3D (Asp-Asp-Asp) domain-containing protein